MNLKRFAAALAVSSLALLSACGGGGSSSSSEAQIRLVNASSAYATLDLSVAGSSAATGVAYGTASAYASATAGTSVTSLVQSAGSTISSMYPTLTAGKHYSLIAYGWPGSMRSTLLQEEETVPAANYAKLLVLNLAPDAGTLDVYLTQNIDDLANASPTVSAIAGGNSSAYTTLSSGSFRLRVTGTGRYADLRLDVPSITLASEQVATLVITPTQGGVLVNGILMNQQSSLSAYGASSARARVVAAMSDNVTVAAQLGSASLMTGSVAPSIGEYQIVGAGSPSLQVSVAGQAQPVATPALQAGYDYTMLVWGSPAAPQITVLNDDNRLPSTSGTAKFRLIHGVANLNAGLTMALDYSAIASNVLPGSASAAVSVSSSSSSLLNISSPTSGTPVFSISSLPVVSSGVYTVFMMGGASNIQGVLRRER